VPGKVTDLCCNSNAGEAAWPIPTLAIIASQQLINKLSQVSYSLEHSCSARDFVPCRTVGLCDSPLDAHSTASYS
jgi:hypothetical protein